MEVRRKGEYYGNQRLALDFNGIILSEYSYHEESTPWHFHENPYFMYVLQGNMTDVNLKKQSLIPSGSLVFHNWQDPHLNKKKSKQARGFHLELKREWFDDKKLNINLWEGSQVLNNPRYHHLIAKIYYEFRKQDEYSKLAIEFLLLQLCEEIGAVEERGPSKEPSWVNNLRTLIVDGTEPHSLKSLSKQLGVHPVHISRSIPEYFNDNLGEYMRKRKIKRAFDFMNDPQYSLTEIAYESGFADQSHFTKTFKMYFGCTPKTFRNRLSA